MVRVYDDKSPVLPVAFSVNIGTSIPLVENKELVGVHRVAKLIYGFRFMVKRHLMNKHTAGAWHIERDEKPQGSLLTTVPSILRFHWERLLPGSGFLDCLAPMWRWWIRFTLAISGASTVAVCLR